VTSDENCSDNQSEEPEKYEEEDQFQDELREYAA
jgi:hypothetical protein